MATHAQHAQDQYRYRVPAGYDKGMTYYRLYADEAHNHYIGFMRTRDGEPDQYLMASDITWHRDPSHYAARIKLTTPPENIRRINILGGILV